MAGRSTERSGVEIVYSAGRLIESGCSDPAGLWARVKGQLIAEAQGLEKLPMSVIRKRTAGLPFDDQRKEHEP